MDNINFDGIKEAITGLTDLIKKITTILANFIDSWKKQPAAYDDTAE